MIGNWAMSNAPSCKVQAPESASQVIANADHGGELSPELYVQSNDRFVRLFQGSP